MILFAILIGCDVLWCGPKKKKLKFQYFLSKDADSVNYYASSIGRIISE